MKSAASSSADPPISPINTTASVDLSSLNILRTSTKFSPVIGSPPIPRRDDSWSIRSDDCCSMLLRVGHQNHTVSRRDHLSNDDYRIETCVNCFHACLLCKGSRDKNDRCVGIYPLKCGGHRIVDGYSLSASSSFSWRDACDDLCPIFAHESSVKRALVACYTLYDRPGLFSYKKSHSLCDLRGRYQSSGLVHLLESCDARRVEDLLSLIEVCALHSDDERFLQADDFLYFDYPFCNLVASGYSC